MGKVVDLEKFANQTMHAGLVPPACDCVAVGFSWPLPFC